MVNLPVTKTSISGILNTSLACVKYGVEIPHVIERRENFYDSKSDSIPKES